ncbi:DNA-directed RNA polymerase [Aphelenchoides besseyi]|nr:DNA-directed RNA polymerase [Aphelenchoides besseyi]
MWKRRGFRLQLCSLCRLSALQSQRLASSAIAVEESEPRRTRKSTKSTGTPWQNKIALQLNKEMISENRRYSVEKQRKLDEVKIACFIRYGRSQQLLQHLSQRAKVLTGRSAFLYNEIFLVTLKSAADFLAWKVSDEQWLSSRECISFISNFVELLASIPLVTQNVVLMYAFLFTEIGRIPGTSKNREIVRNRYFARRDVRTNFRQDQLLLSDEDFKKVLKHFNWDARSTIDMPYLGYDENLSLVHGLLEPCSSSSYRGSPFSIPGLDKEKCMKLFRAEVANEQQFCIAVKNHSRHSDEKPMEKMIADWKWKDAIGTTFTSMREKIGNVDVKLYLAGLEASKVAQALLECVVSALCQGRHLITVPELRHDMTRAILVLSHREFIQSSMANSRELFENVCAEYFRYFEEERLARIYTCREWWFLCARKFRLNPEFELPFSNFTLNVTEELGSFLMDVVMNACKVPQNKLTKQTPKKAFTYRNVGTEEISAIMGDDEKKIMLNKMIQLHPSLVNYINEHQFEKLLFPSHTLPMTLPPRPWLDAGNCGPQYTRSTQVLRNLYDFPERNVNVEMRKRLKTPVQARPVFDALNDLGITPWIVNKAMLKELIHAFDLAKNVEKFDLLQKLTIPMHRNTIHVPTQEEYFGTKKRVADIETSHWFEFSRKQYESTKRRNESNSLWCWLMYRIVLAHHFQNDILFFPHNMDFRGRVYPISPHLNHMGDDINRCLLKFARGKKLGKDGLKWLKLHCINLTGLKKRSSIQDRLVFADEILPKILDSANYPWAENSWWMESDEPWQTLSACIEIRDALEWGSESAEFVSHLPIHQDGSCNGLQHYAALGRDKEGAMEVNLLPRDTPADLYSNVARSVEMKRREDEKSESEEVRKLALELRAQLPQDMPREVIKQTVMTTVYGVTNYGAKLQIKKQLKARNISNEKLMAFSDYLASKTLGSLSEAFESSMILKDWFRQCARTTVKLMQPVEWITPLGLPVMQPYLKQGKKFGHLCLLPVLHKQVDAFPPNFVHSLDSTHMLLTALHCRRQGITFAAVHDCFWTHAIDVDAMNEICREQFILLHKQPIVQDLAKSFRENYLNEKIVEYMNEEERQTFSAKFTPTIKRGDLDIEEVRKSVYFFS